MPSLCVKSYHVNDDEEPCDWISSEEMPKSYTSKDRKDRTRNWGKWLVRGEKKEEYVFRGIRAMRINTDDQIPFKYIVRKKRRKQLIPCCNQLTSYYLPEFINFIYSFLDLPRVVQLRGHDRRYGLHPWHYRKNTAVTLANETTYRRANESVSHSYMK